MLALQIGPLALPTAPLLLLLSLWGSSWLAGRLASRAEADPGARKRSAEAAAQTVLTAAFIGFAAARTAHLMLQLDAYLASPWSMLDVRDGGWHAGVGLGAGAAWLLWRGWRSPALRRPLALAACAGALAWGAASTALGLHDKPALPALPMVALADGQALTLTEAARGRPVVVNLWASWCGPCRAEMPVLAAAARRETQIGFLFVNQGESVATIHDYLNREQLQLPEVLVDAASQLGPAVGSRGLPTTLFYDARGRLLDAHMGVLNAAALESRLRALRR